MFEYPMSFTNTLSVTSHLWRVSIADKYTDEGEDTPLIELIELIEEEEDREAAGTRCCIDRKLSSSDFALNLMFSTIEASLSQT